MSETTDRESDELGAALRLLATDAEVAPTLTGERIRSRGAARGRRRRVAGAAAVSVALVAGAVFGLPRVLDAVDSRQLPAASLPSPSVPDVSTPPLSLPQATLDTAKGLLRITGRDGEVRSVKVWVKNTPMLRLTVVDKGFERRLPAGFGDEYEIEARWVIELSQVGGGTVFLGTVGNTHIARDRIIDVGAADAKWVYQQLGVGDNITPD